MTKTILIIEDDELNLKLENELLQSRGYKTLTSADGKDTLKLAREHHPDLIIMDIQLPGVSGLDYTKALKADDSLQDIPIIAVTAFVMDGDKERILKAGCNAYIPKPFSTVDFIKTIEKFIGR